MPDFVRDFLRAINRDFSVWMDIEAEWPVRHGGDVETFDFLLLPDGDNGEGGEGEDAAAGSGDGDDNGGENNAAAGPGDGVNDGRGDDAAAGSGHGDNNNGGDNAAAGSSHGDNNNEGDDAAAGTGDGVDDGEGDNAAAGSGHSDDNGNDEPQDDAGPPVEGPGPNSPHPPSLANSNDYGGGFGSPPSSPVRLDDPNANQQEGIAHGADGLPELPGGTASTSDNNGGGGYSAAQVPPIQMPAMLHNDAAPQDQAVVHHDAENSLELLLAAEIDASENEGGPGAQHAPAQHAAAPSASEQPSHHVSSVDEEGEVSFFFTPWSVDQIAAHFGTCIVKPSGGWFGCMSLLLLTTICFLLLSRWGVEGSRPRKRKGCLCDQLNRFTRATYMALPSFRHRSAYFILICLSLALKTALRLSPLPLHMKSSHRYLRS